MAQSTAKAKTRTLRAQKASPLAKELRKLRIDHDITRAQMAKNLGLSDRELARIEDGKVEITDSFLSDVAVKYAPHQDASDSILQALKLAYVNSITMVMFDLNSMTTQQRLRVITLRAALAEENAVALAQAEGERLAEIERKKAERLAKKSTTTPSKIKVSEIEANPQPIEVELSVMPKVKTSVVDDALDDLDLDGVDDLTDDELDILAA